MTLDDMRKRRTELRAQIDTLYDSVNALKAELKRLNQDINDQIAKETQQ